MTITKDEYEIILSYRELTPEMQKAILWLIDNIDYIRCLVKGDVIPHNKMSELQAKAREDNNFEFLALLMYKETVDSDRYKTSISDNSNE